MKQKFKLIVGLFLLAILTTSCYSDKSKFDHLAKVYPNCDIFSKGERYFACDTTTNKGAIYEIHFYYGIKISTVDRIR